MNRKYQLMWLAAIVLLAAGLRLYCYLNLLPLRDSLTYAACAENYRAGGDFAAFYPTPESGTAPPAFFAVLAAGSRIGLDPVAWGISFNFGCSLLSVWLIWLIAGKLFENPVYPLCAAALAATMPSLAENGTQLMRDPMYIALALAALLFAMRYFTSGKNGDLLWFSLAAAAAGLTRREGVELILVFGIFQLPQLLSAKTFRRTAATLAAAAAVYVILTAGTIFLVARACDISLAPLPGVTFRAQNQSNL